MQEHFKVQRRIEEKNTIKEHWRPHSENWSQKRTTLSPNLDRSLSRGEDLRRGKHQFTFHQEGLLKCSEVLWSLAPLGWDKEWMLRLSLCGVMISPSLLCKRPFFAQPRWWGSGKASSIVLTVFNLPSFLCGWKSPRVSLLGLKASLISHHHIPGCAQVEKCPLLLKSLSWEAGGAEDRMNPARGTADPASGLPDSGHDSWGSGAVLLWPPSTPWQVVCGLASCSWIKNTLWPSCQEYELPL